MTSEEQRAALIAAIRTLADYAERYPVHLPPRRPKGSRQRGSSRIRAITATGGRSKSMRTK